MERIQAVVVGLALVAIGLGIWVGQPAYFFNSAQLAPGKDDENRCFPALFSFGSSVADTGTKHTAFPSGEPKDQLQGSTFFGKHSKRSSDGRLHIDFWATALKIPFLDAYLKSVGSNFRRGVNFAAVGAVALNSTPYSPFHLSFQHNQFREFKHDVLALLEEEVESSTRKCEVNKLPVKEYFEDALYMLAIGSNDIMKEFLVQQPTFEEIESRIPEISNEILRVVESLHAEGARYILVEAVYPLGCSPLALTVFVGTYPDQLDAVGCLKPVNDIVQHHNALLKKGIAELDKRLSDASIAVVDTFSVRYDIIANPDQYGFNNPLKACCGTGGAYNFSPRCRCGCRKTENGVLLTAGMCNNVSSHVWWDEIHFTDAFNHAVMKRILKGGYFEPSFELIRNGCDLFEI